MNKNLYTHALSAAAESAGIKMGDIIKAETRPDGSLFHIIFHTHWQRHEYYIDSASLEVLGVGCEPQLYGFSHDYPRYPI